MRGSLRVPRQRLLTIGSIRSSIDRMRTTLDLPADLLEEGRRILGFKSKTDTVIAALRELIRRRRLDELGELAGRVAIEVDLPQSRRRPRGAAK